MTRGLDPARLASDASILRALLRAGADRLDEDALDDGYAALASATDDVGRAETQAARARYAARTDRAPNA